MPRTRLLLIALVLLCGCDGATSDPGLEARLRVRAAQYVPGALPPAGAGPAITSLRVPHAQILPGLRRELLSGSLPPDATAVLLARVGDPGHWVVTAGAPTIEEPDFPTFTAELSFARDTPPGVQTLELSAVRGDGAVGPPGGRPRSTRARARAARCSPSNCAGTPTRTSIYTSWYPAKASSGRATSTPTRHRRQVRSRPTRTRTEAAACSSSTRMPTA